MKPWQILGATTATRKYDLLTALGCYALSTGKTEQKLALRLITLITARYDWRLGLLSVGQKEIARLWSVDERTVKREMAKLRAMGWLVLQFPARRGKVASYSIDLSTIEATTGPAWSRVGPDFEQRMRTPEVQAPARPALTSNVLAFPRHEFGGQGASSPDATDRSEWTVARELLRRDDPALFGNWIEALTRKGRAGACVVVSAPGAFHASYVRTHLTDRILVALRCADPAVKRLTVEA